MLPMALIGCGNLGGARELGCDRAVSGYEEVLDDIDAAIVAARTTSTIRSVWP